jgi:hypothetical protein
MDGRLRKLLPWQAAAEKPIVRRIKNVNDFWTGPVSGWAPSNCDTNLESLVVVFVMVLIVVPTIRTFSAAWPNQLDGSLK